MVKIGKHIRKKYTIDKNSYSKFYLNIEIWIQNVKIKLF